MNILRELSIIFGILFVGEFINRFFELVLPGNVIGMLLLFFLLFTGLIRLEDIEKVSDFLLSNLTVLFIPAGVGIMKYYNLLQGRVSDFLIVVILTTILVMIFTGYTVQITQRMVKKWKQ